ncbi:MAG: STAS domain-containing protein [Bacteroidales bacterium]
MKVEHKQVDRYIVVTASGRLDASWADYFSEHCLDLIRNGHHHLIMDSQELSFLSSAGIRSLLLINKELSSVNGSFLIINAQPFVAKTIAMTGFGQWLSHEVPVEIRQEQASGAIISGETSGPWVLDPTASLKCSIDGGWEPWKPVVKGNMVLKQFPESVFALGIGGVAEEDGMPEHFGEFLAIGGNVILQPPEERIRPDYLLTQKEFIPELKVIQAVSCSGGMSHLFRFVPEEQGSSKSITDIALTAMAVTKSKTVAFVVLAEIDGLVGSTLIQSPARLEYERELSFPEIREWLSFCGERAYAGHQAMVFGISAETNMAQGLRFLRPLPSDPNLCGHFHAAVFPYQPLQNGKIGLHQNIRKFLDGPPPEALMHLVDDQRPTTGLGQSAFIRGACWCAGIQNMEDVI